MKLTSLITLSAALAYLTPFAVHAQEMHHDHVAMSAAPAATAEMASGEVRKVDKDAGKLTIKHGPLSNLDMPAMTMVFRVKDAGMLDQLKPGDKVEFEADKVNGQLTVMRMEVKN